MRQRERETDRKIERQRDNETETERQREQITSGGDIGAISRFIILEYRLISVGKKDDLSLEPWDISRKVRLSGGIILTLAYKVVCY